MTDISGKKILLHACCGPCSLGAIDPLLSEGAEVSLFFYNPCIIDGEFERRLSAIEQVAAHYGLELIVPTHDYLSYKSYAAPHSSAKEGGERCSLCFDDRLGFTARYAAEHGFDGYTTTLTVSPHKNSKLIFSIAHNYDGISPFVERDFKKRDGFLHSCNLARELNIYRQNFCGCEYSVWDGAILKNSEVTA